jgi:hypothetical protein
MHSWAPRFRVVPPGGEPYVVDVSGYKTLSVCQPRQTPTSIMQETINLERTTTRRAVQVSVEMVFEFASGDASELELLDKILNPALDESFAIELSLDAGVTYREVVLGPDAPSVLGNIAGKNVGSTYAMTWDCVAPIDHYFAAGAGGWA